LIVCDIAGVVLGASVELFDIVGWMVRQRVHLEIGPECFNRV
jgi:hypothetical protein